MPRWCSWPTTSPGCTAPVGQFFQTNPTKNDYEPRVGFAWNPFGDGTTAVRGAFGIYDQLPLPYIYSTYTAIAYPYAQDEVLIGTVPAGSFPIQRRRRWQRRAQPRTSDGISTRIRNETTP